MRWATNCLLVLAAASFFQASEAACSDVRDVVACAGTECYTCGARIDWLVDSAGMARPSAEQQVAAEFPTECGACAATPPPPTCSDVWNVLACDGDECYSCGARITYLESTGMTRAAAEQQVGGVEFPSECGPCGSGGGTPPATPQPPTTTPPASIAKKSIVVTNRCSHTVWPGMNGRHPGPNGAYFFGTKDSANPAGFELKAGASKTISIPNGIASFTIWPRTGCSVGSDGRFTCETGECGNPNNNWDGTCYNSGPEGGNLLAEATVNRAGSSFYDLSQVDGYTLPLSIVAHHGTTVAGVAAKFNCGNPACKPDMTFAKCPPESRVSKNGKVVGCNNIHAVINDANARAAYPIMQTYYDNLDTRSHIECSCLVGDCVGETTAQLLTNLKNGNTIGVDKTGYCCSPYNSLYSSPDSVSSHICYVEDKPKPLNNFGGGKRYDEIFKEMCPEAYSWQFNDDESTYQCGGADLTLEVVFC
ncbi:Thaumatin-like protein 1 [Diplonema papillatum]|nr:Thaumatin-like protein 1 [Diplonema papillatum]|eukprot:gene16378-25106_t